MSSPFVAIESTFHEPSRLAIVSELSGIRGGISFSDLKKACALTDGNLSRHLTVLEKAEIVQIEKTFVGSKPRTTIFLTASGRREFLRYLSELEELLKHASRRARGQEQSSKVRLSNAVKSKLKPA